MSRIHKQNEYCAGNNVFVLENIIPQQEEYFEQKYFEEEYTQEEAISEADAESYCADLIMKAQKEAEEIIRNAKQEAELILKETRSQAYDEGFEQGEKEGFQAYQTKISQAEQLIYEIQEEKYKVLSDMEGEILKLSISIAEKIINKTLTEDETAFLSVISNAIKRSADAEKVTVYISPEQFDNMDGLKQSLKLHFNRIKSFDIVKREMEDMFDCLIDTDYEQIDAGVRTQIKQIEQAFQLSQSYA